MGREPGIDLYMTPQHDNDMAVVAKVIMLLHNHVTVIKNDISLIPRPIQKLGERAWYPLFTRV